MNNNMNNNINMMNMGMAMNAMNMKMNQNAANNTNSTANAAGSGYPMQQQFGIQGQQHPQPQQQQQFMMQGMAPQYAPQRVPQGMQPQQQPQAQQHPVQQPTTAPQSQFPDLMYNNAQGSQQLHPPQPQQMISSGAGAAGHPKPTPVPNSSTPTSASGPTPQGNAQQRVPSRPMMTRPGGVPAPANMAMNMGTMNMAAPSAVAAVAANGNGSYRRQATNTETLKFLDFCELVGVRSESTKNILYWKKIITEYFSESGVLRYSVKAGVDSRQFEFSVPIIPRFFFSIIQSGVTRIEIQPGMLRAQVLPNGTTYLESPRCCVTHHYADGSYVNIHGSMKGIMNQQLRIDWLDFQTHVFIPGVEWPSLEKLLSDEVKMKDVLGMLNDSNGDSDKDDKSGVVDGKRLNVLQKFRSNFQVFHSMSNFGLQESVMRVMQVSDVMAHLRSLMMFSISSNATGPLHALDEFVARSQNKNDTPNKKPTNNGANGGGSTNNTGNSSTPVPPSSSNTNNNGNKKSETPSQKNSPMPMSDQQGAPSPQVTRNHLDLSQSTLSKRRRKSTVGDLSPKSIAADSPRLGKGGNKKAKR